MKWVGGKRGIIQELTQRLPLSFNAYYEPFVGGGALFFELCHQIKRASLSDINIDLVITFNVIRRVNGLNIELDRAWRESWIGSLWQPPQNQPQLLNERPNALVIVPKKDGCQLVEIWKRQAAAHTPPA